MRKKREKLSLSSKLPGPGTKPKEEPKSFHYQLHDEVIKGVTLLTKVVSRHIDNITAIESRLDNLERKRLRRK